MHEAFLQSVSANPDSVRARRIVVSLPALAPECGEYGGRTSIGRPSFFLAVPSCVCMLTTSRSPHARP